MPKPRALRPDELRRSLVGRFEQKAGGEPGLADRLRQLHTKFGARSRRVFLVWVEWSGDERGEGVPKVLRVLEILPTPKVSDATAVTRSGFNAGILPVGSLRIDEVSAAFAEETLLGRLVPGAGPLNSKTDFFYEVAEDGRSGNEPLRSRFRLFGQPNRAETKVCWQLFLERASEDRLRTLEVPVDSVDPDET